MLTAIHSFNLNNGWNNDNVQGASASSFILTFSIHPSFTFSLNWPSEKLNDKFFFVTQHDSFVLAAPDPSFLYLPTYLPTYLTTFVLFNNICKLYSFVNVLYEKRIPALNCHVNEARDTRGSRGVCLPRERPPSQSNM